MSSFCSKQAGGNKPSGISKSPAMLVLEEMNENLASENASLLREVSRIQAQSSNGARSGIGHPGVPSYVEL